MQLRWKMTAGVAVRTFLCKVGSVVPCGLHSTFFYFTIQEKWFLCVCAPGRAVLDLKDILVQPPPFASVKSKAWTGYVMQTGLLMVEPRQPWASKCQGCCFVCYTWPAFLKSAEGQRRSALVCEESVSCLFP